MTLWVPTANERIPISVKHSWTFSKVSQCAPEWSGKIIAFGERLGASLTGVHVRIESVALTVRPGEAFVASPLSVIGLPIFCEEIDLYTLVVFPSTKLDIIKKFILLRL